VTDIRLKEYLDEKVDLYNNTDFIKNDPISIAHKFTKLQDIEIIGFWTAMLSWGLRKTIINKGIELCNLMDNSPYDFVLNHSEIEKKAFLNFKHRTFNSEDALYFLEFFKDFYSREESLEKAFRPDVTKSFNIYESLITFHKHFFSLSHAPKRTQKHIANPYRKSTAKRINMFLRWMVRKDDKGVDFGLWKTISPSELKIPLDVHVDRIARSLGLVKRRQTDWLTVVELTDTLKTFDPADPVKYDFALFGIGVREKEIKFP